MKKIIRINYIFWKEGPLLFGMAQSKLPRFLAEKSNVKRYKAPETCHQ